MEGKVAGAMARVMAIPCRDIHKEESIVCANPLLTTPYLSSNHKRMHIIIKKFVVVKDWPVKK